MKTEIHLRKNFDLHENSLWLPIDRQIANLCAVIHMDLKLELQSNKSYNIYSPEYVLNW